MSADSKKSIEGGDELWFLKIHDGGVFGPVPASGLRSWAEQGRIAPGNELSRDKTTWVAAETIPELALTWWVEREDGSVQGPFNRKALDLLVKDGSVPAEARLVERAPGERPPATPAANADDSPRMPNGKRIKRVTTEQRRIKELENRLQETLAETEKIHQTSRPKANVPEEVSRLRRELVKTQTDLQTHKVQATTLAKEKKALQKQLVLFEERIAELGTSPAPDPDMPAADELQAALDLAQQTLRESEERAVELEAQVEELTGAAAQEQDLNSQLISLEKKLKRQNAQAGTQTKALSKLQQQLEQATAEQQTAAELAESLELELTAAQAQCVALQSDDPRPVDAELQQMQQRLIGAQEARKAEQEARASAQEQTRRTALELADAQQTADAAALKIEALAQELAALRTTQTGTSDADDIQQQLAQQQAAFNEERRQFEEQMADLQAHLDTADAARSQTLQQLEEEKRTLAETLEAANGSEMALRQDIAELETALTQQDHVPLRDPGPVLSAIVHDQIERTDAALESERVFFETIRDSFIEKQQSLREQLRQLQAIGASSTHITERNTAESAANEETPRLREQLMRSEQEHRREVERAEARENQQTRKLSQLDTQLAEMRQRLAQAENEATELRSVKDELRTKEHQLALLRSQYDEERSHWREQEATLGQQIDQTERLRSSPRPDAPVSEINHQDVGEKDPNFNIRKWMKLR